MYSKGDRRKWPMFLDLSREECEVMLRGLEIRAYASVVCVLRAQGRLTREKKALLQNLADMLSISKERHKAEVVVAINSEDLATIAEYMDGPDTDAEWIKESRRLVPLMPMSKPRPEYVLLADHYAKMIAAQQAALLPQHLTAKNIKYIQKIKKEAEEDVSDSTLSTLSSPSSTASTSSDTPSTMIAPTISKPAETTTAVFSVPAAPAAPPTTTSVNINTASSATSSSTIEAPPQAASLISLHDSFVVPVSSATTDVQNIPLKASIENITNFPTSDSGNLPISQSTNTLPVTTTCLAVGSPSPSTALLPPSNSFAPVSTSIINFPVATSVQPTAESTSPLILTQLPQDTAPITSSIELVVVPPATDPMPSYCDPSVEMTVSVSTSSTLCSSPLVSTHAPITSVSFPLGDVKSVPISNFSSSSSILSSIPLISIPPSSSLPPISAADLGQLMETTTITQSTSTIVAKKEEVNAAPTLMLPSGMSIQLREDETEKPKKRKRPVSQEATPPLQKKLFAVPLNKANTVRTMGPMKISVNTATPPASATATQKVIIVSNTNTMTTPNILQRSLNIVKSTSRLQSPSQSGNNLPITTSKILPKMVTLPAKCRPRSNSFVIPLTASTKNIQLSTNDNNASAMDANVKCMNIPGTTRILPKPSSMLIVNPSTSKVPLAAGGTKLINPRTIIENYKTEGMVKPTAKPNVVIVHKGPAPAKGLNITNASKEIVNKVVLSGKPVAVHPKPQEVNQSNHPLPIATTSGNQILLDLRKIGQFNRNATIAEILKASGILPAGLSSNTNADSDASTSTECTLPVQEEASANTAPVSEESVDLAMEEEKLTSQDEDKTEEENVMETEQVSVHECREKPFTTLTNSDKGDVTPVTDEEMIEAPIVSSQIVPEALPSEVVDEENHGQITFVPSLNEPVTIQHSDLDATNMPLEEYTSQQLEDQGLT